LAEIGPLFPLSTKITFAKHKKETGVPGQPKVTFKTRNDPGLFGGIIYPTDQKVDFAIILINRIIEY
jgi:hypothetical protein